MTFRTLEDAVFHGQGLADAVQFASQAGHVNDLFDDHQGNRISLLHYFVMAREKRGVDLMLGRGADPNTRGGDGMTPLWAAVFNDDAEMVRTLAAAGADLDAAEPRNGDTPLHAALTTGRNAIASLLLELGANPDVANRHGLSARALRGFGLLRQVGKAAPAAGQQQLAAASEDELHDVLRLLLELAQTPQAAATMSAERRASLARLRKELDAAMELPREARAVKLNLLLAELRARMPT